MPYVLQWLQSHWSQQRWQPDEGIKDGVCLSCLRRGRLSTVVIMGQALPVPTENPGYSSPTTQIEAMGKDLCHKTTGPHLGLPSNYLDGMTSQYRTSHSPFTERTAAQSQWYPLMFLVKSG